MTMLNLRISKGGLILACAIIAIFSIYTTYHLSTEFSTFLEDSQFYLQKAVIVNEDIPYTRRFTPEGFSELKLITGGLRHPSYILLLSLFASMGRPFMFLIPNLILLLLSGHLISKYCKAINSKRRYLDTLIILFSSGIIFWSSVAMKEILIVFLYLSFIDIYFFEHPQTIKNKSTLFNAKNFKLILLFSLLLITRFWMPFYIIFVVGISKLTIGLPKLIKSFSISAKALIITILLFSIGLYQIIQLRSFLNLSIIASIARIFQPNPINLLGTPFEGMILQTIMYKFVLFYAMYKIFKYICSNRTNFLVYSICFYFSGILLANSMLRGDRHQLLYHLTISMISIYPFRAIEDIKTHHNPIESSN